MLLFGAVAIALVLLYLWVAFWVLPNSQFFIAYPPANTTYTNANFTAALHLSVQTVPSVLNGVTAVTSIIVAFTGVYIGFVLREIPNNTKRDRAIRIFLMVLVPFSILSILLLDFYAYVYLLIGGIWFSTAILFDLSGFLWGSLILVGLFIFVNFRLNEQEGKEASIECQSSGLPAQEEKEAENKKSDKPETKEKEKNVNVFVNVS